MMKSNLSNAKIYKLYSTLCDKIYVGSTCGELGLRLSNHKTAYKRYKKGLRGYCTAFEIMQYEDVKIQLIDDYVCNNRNELLKKEGEYIQKENTVNIRVAGRGWKERRRCNIDSYRKYQREYHRTYRKRK